MSQNGLRAVELSGVVICEERSSGLTSLKSKENTE